MLSESIERSGRVVEIGRFDNTGIVIIVICGIVVIERDDVGMARRSQKRSRDCVD